MSVTWESEAPPPQHRIDRSGKLRILRRGLPIVLTVMLGLIVLFLLRLVEKPLFGLRRPISPWVTQAVCRISLMWMGLRYVRHGTPMRGQGTLVANHSSWLDIFALNASDRLYFVSKAEVARWPGIGFLARSVGTVFIARDRRQAIAHKQLFEELLAAGQQLMFFPEGTSTDGLRVLPFKTTLFAALLADGLAHRMSVQPVTVVYHAPDGEDPRCYGWWGDMEFASHLLATLALRRQGRVEVIFHDPLPVAQFADRKNLASAAERAVRAGHALVAQHAD